MKMRTARWAVVGAAAGVLAAGVWLVGSIGTNSPAEASTRPATAAELAVPPEVTALLKQEAGLNVESPGSATISINIAETAAQAIAKTEYGTQVPADTVPNLYLVRVAETPGATDTGLQVGSVQWLVVYRNLDISTPGPAGADGQPTTGAVVRSAVLVVDAETGTIDLAHWTSSTI